MAMAKTPPYWDEKPSGATSKYREYPERAKGTTSFIVFVFSIFVYMSIFYLLNISPSTFLNNNKFWFFISNTLILIIAAEYGAFSSSKNKHDLYEEYVMHSQLARSTTTTNISSFVSPKKEEVEYQSFQENQEKALEIVVVQSEPEKITENFQDDEKKKKKNYRRSKSEKPRREVVVSKNITRSRSDYSETEKEDDDDDDDDDIQEPAESVVEENDEFSNMSDEELNRRVEEFIQSFNRQIRLQRDGNLLPLNLVN